MIPPAILNTLCFPWMLVSSSGELIDSQDGTLFRLSAGARLPASIEYCTRAPVGWSRCPAGYAVYGRMLPAMSGAMLVLHGLKVRGISTISGKSETLSIKTDPVEIERYVAKTIATFSKIQEDITNIVRRSVHEVRNINKDIKSATDMILSILSEKEVYFDEIRAKATNIKALSEILTAQTDFLDYFVNPTLALIPDRGIQVHNKFFKTRESLGSRAARKGINIRFLGKSDAQIAGARVFEVVPFILLENAIKYSPEAQPIDIVFQETEDELAITVRNVGPSLKEDEIGRVFDMGKRESNAIAARISGYGIGLHFVKELVERHHRGTIELGQSGDPRVFGGVEYRSTEVVLRLPRVR